MSKNNMPSLELHLSRDLFVTGRRLSGVVVFRLSKPTSIRSLTVSVCGCETPAGVSIARSLRRPSYFFFRDMLLSGMVASRFASERLAQLWNAFLGRDTGRRLSAGEHTYPFTIVLPASLPPSYQGTAGKIDYRVSARVMFPIGRGLKAHRDVPVAYVPRAQRGRPIALSYPTAGGTVHDSEINVKFSIPRRNVELGGAISGSFVVENPKLVAIARATVSLERCEWVRLGSAKELHRECVSSRTVTPESPRCPRIEADFELAAPADAPPTVEGTAISVIWLLKLYLDTAPPIELKTPVTVFAPVGED